MKFDLMFFVQSIMLGVGLAMDAFSVSMANGLNEPKMKKRKVFLIAGVFALFQAIMPLAGWVVVHAAANAFAVFNKFIPLIALVLLSFIGGKMLLEGIRGCEMGESCEKLTFFVLLVQGVATSIDALSVGFTIAHYKTLQALVCASVIAAVTFIICFVGVVIGKKFGTKLAGKAGILGGVILIAIGLEIFLDCTYTNINATTIDININNASISIIPRIFLRISGIHEFIIIPPI